MSSIVPVPKTKTDCWATIRVLRWLGSHFHNLSLSRKVSIGCFKCWEVTLAKRSGSSVAIATTLPAGWWSRSSHANQSAIKALVVKSIRQVAAP